MNTKKSFINHKVGWIVAFLLAGSPLLWAAGKQEFLLHDGDRIVFLGDSITAAGAAPEGYVTLFRLFCGVNGFDVTVVNAGVGGHKSNDMLARLKKDVLDVHPTWVSVSCGVNDVWHFDKTPPKGIPLPEYKKNMTEIVDHCQAAGLKVLLLTATPIFEDLQSKENQKLLAYNAFLRDLAKKKGLVLCDLFKIFAEQYRRKETKENILTVDGVHMNPKGNRLMAREILKALGASRRQLRLAEKRWELQ